MSFNTGNLRILTPPYGNIGDCFLDDLNINGGAPPVTPTYFTLAGITDPTEIAAVNTLQTTLQAGTNIWGRLDRIFPFSPTSLNAASYCCKSLTQLTWFNTPTHGSTGVAFNGTTQYGLPAEELTTYTNFGVNGSTGIYLTAVGSLTGTQYVYGASGADNGDNASSIYLRQASTVLGCASNGAVIATQTATVDPSFQLTSRTTTTNLKRYRNGVQAATSATSSLGRTLPLTRKISVGGLQSAAAYGVTSLLPSTVAFFTIGAGLDATDQLTLYNAIQAYQTSLSRNV